MHLATFIESSTLISKPYTLHYFRLVHVHYSRIIVPRKQYMLVELTPY